MPDEKIDLYLKDLLNKCKQIHPEYMPITEVVDYNEKKFIIVWAPGGIIRPYSSPKSMAKENKERVYWIRKMATTDQTTDRAGNNLAEKKILYLIKQNPRITQARIADELEVPKSTVKYYVGKLSKAQKINREGTIHNGRWIVL